MGQPIKKEINKKPVKIKKQTTKLGRIRAFKKKLQEHKTEEYGTSKLEARFATEFLDKLGVEYVYQYKAVSIGRYFDFRICYDGVPSGPIIEVNGSYWHGDPRLYEEKDLNKTQIRDKKIDEIKKSWCSRNGIPIIYVWEKDINESPKMVLDYLKEVLKLSSSNKSKRH